MGLFDSISNVVDNFGVTPSNNGSQIETLGSPAETNQGGAFGFLGNVFGLAKQGAEVFNEFQTSEQEREIEKASAPAVVKTGLAAVPPLVWIAGGGVLLLVIGVLAFKK